MKRAAVLILALVAAGCSSLPPQPIYAGDVCFRCRRAISNTKLAGEIIDSSGRAFKFKTPACMARYVTTVNPDAAAAYVTDYQTGRLIKVTAATFVPATIGEGREATQDYLAFSSQSTAREMAAREKSTPIDWKQLLEAARPATP